MDEATSNVFLFLFYFYFYFIFILFFYIIYFILQIDIETDSIIQKTIRKEFSEQTVLTIAHRINTIFDYDRIIVMNDGFVAEFDSPQNLLNNKESIFYSMANESKLN